MRTAILAALVGGALTASAQYINKSSVLDGSGSRSQGGTYTNLSAAGQPGGIAISSGGGFVNQAGFLNTFSIKPALDSDGDGLADELDQDNDNDGLADSSEITGAGFAPATPTLVNTADSDGDGTVDGFEAVAGTDPTDPNALLEITAITNAGAARQVTWLARSNFSYRLLRSDDDQLPPTQVVATVTANGFASPPWYVVSHAAADAGTTSNRSIYAVQPLP